MDLNKSFTCLKLLTSHPTSPERKSRDILGWNELILHLSHKRLSHSLFRALHLFLLHKMDHFKLSNSVAFGTIMVWCNHHYYPVSEHFYHPKRKTPTHKAVVPRGSPTPQSHPYPQPPATTTLLSASVDLSILDISYIQNHDMES